MVYVLLCRGDRYYVGRCAADRVETRFDEHRRGVGAAFTRLHPPHLLVSTAPAASPLDEDAEVLRRMRAHGIDRVRGGSMSQIELPDDVVRTVRRMLDHADGRCFSCGRPGHFASSCGFVSGCCRRA